MTISHTDGDTFPGGRGTFLGGRFPGSKCPRRGADLGGLISSGGQIFRGKISGGGDTFRVGVGTDFRGGGGEGQIS